MTTPFAFVNGSLQLSFSDMSEAEGTKIVLAVLYSIVVLVGITGNIFVIVIVWRKKAMQTTTNCLLFNLAVGDIITLLWASQSQIFSQFYDHPSGKIGDYLCKFITGGTVVTIALTVTIMTLALVAVERHNALIKPMNKSLLLTKRNVVRPVVAFWVVSVILSVPTIKEAKYEDKQKNCVDVWDIDLAYSHRGFVYAMVVLKGILPYCVILYCYTIIIKGLYFSKTIICGQTKTQADKKCKRKVAKLLITVTVAFYFCYIPYAGLVLYVAVMPPRDLISERELLLKLQTAARFLLYFQSCLNPIIYPFHSTNFRRELLKLLSAVMPLNCFDGNKKGYSTPLSNLPSSYRKSEDETKGKRETMTLRGFNLTGVLNQ